MVKRAVLFINGDLARLPRLRLTKSDFLIGVDGGTKLIYRLGKKPDLVVGDFDSLPNPPPPSLFKKSQDLTDTEFALNYCAERGFKEVVLVGVLGGRLDHLITNIFLAARFNLTILEREQTLFFVPGKRVFPGKPGDLVSLIPLLGDCLGVTTTGLKWPLRGEALKFGSSRGISNAMTGKKAGVSLNKGLILVVYNSL